MEGIPWATLRWDGGGRQKQSNGAHRPQTLFVHSLHVRSRPRRSFPFGARTPDTPCCCRPGRTGGSETSSEASERAVGVLKRVPHPSCVLARQPSCPSCFSPRRPKIREAVRTPLAGSLNLASLQQQEKIAAGARQHSTITAHCGRTPSLTLFCTNTPLGKMVP